MAIAEECTNVRTEYGCLATCYENDGTVTLNTGLDENDMPHYKNWDSPIGLEFHIDPAVTKNSYYNCNLASKVEIYEIINEDEED